MKRKTTRRKAEPLSSDKIAEPSADASGDVWNNFGVALIRERELDRAIDAFRHALADSSYKTRSNAWNNLGNAFRYKGEFGEAMKAYQEALDDPMNRSPGGTWNNIGILLRKKGEVDEAIKAYRKALDDPHNEERAKVWTNIGNAFRHKGEIDEAIKAYRTALNNEKNESPGKTWNNLGNALRDKGKLDEAVKAFKNALADPKLDNPALAYRNLARTYVKIGKPNLSRNILHEALAKIKGNDAEYRRTRSLLTLIESQLKPASLTADDRAVVENPAIDAAIDTLETRLIDKVNQAGETQYERYLQKAESTRDNALSILRGWSSAVTLLEGSERRWRGGGYFLKWRGCGCVIDPGFYFLINFHDAGYHGREIDAVIVSHNHSDHNDDLKPIDDLKYELYKRLAPGRRADTKPYVLMWDEDTAHVTKFSTNHPEHQHSPIVFPAGFPHLVDLSEHKSKLPLRVMPFKVKHSDDVPSSMGMVIELLENKHVKIRVGYTADTCFFAALPKQLKNCDVLLLHISQPTIEELQDETKFKEDHLGYRGAVRLLKLCQPKLALIGEFWAGYTDLRIDLVKGIRSLSGCENVFPAGLGMHLHLPDLSIECTDCHQLTPFDQTKVAPPTDNFGDLAYLCPNCILQ